MKRNIVVVSLMIVTMVMMVSLARIGAQSAGQGESQSNQGQSPPQAAIDACSGKSDGATCEFTAPRGDTKTGTCESKQDVIACKPDDKPNDGQSGDNSQGQPNSKQKGKSQDQSNSGQKDKTPPQAAIDACSGKTDGATCEFIGPRGDNEIGTCETRDDLIACKPNNRPQGQGEDNQSKPPRNQQAQNAPGTKNNSQNPPRPGDQQGKQGGGYSVEQAVSDRAQLTTIAFAGLAYLTGDLCGDTFLPPGKVADFSGFQILRDNDPTSMGHNTDFVTIIAFNVLHILTPDQISQLIARAQNQMSQINNYAYKRFALMQAFRRLLEGNLPAGTTGLSKQAVMAYSAELYRVDGEISYDRAQLMGSIIRSLTADQKAAFEHLKSLNGIGNWDRALSDPLQSFHLDADVSVGVMTYASEMYSWYAGSVEADTYFCPERQATYFGSFYLKDGPAIGNPNYTIDEQLTASAGEDFLRVLTASQSDLVTNLVATQQSDLSSIVTQRRSIATQLRRFIADGSASSSSVLSLSERYGELDGAIVYEYATHFAQVAKSLSSAQRAELERLVAALGYSHPSGAFLYSAPIPMPAITNSDFLFE